MMPAEFQTMLRRIDVLERKVAALSTATRPNQTLSTYNNVEFNEILVTNRGTWVPTFLGSTVAGVFTYTIQIGYFVELSNIIFLLGRVGISAIGTPPTGSMRIGGLPYVANATYTGSLTFGRISNFNYTAAALDLTAIVNTGGQVASLYESFDSIGVVAAPAANFANVNCEFFFTGMYLGA